MPVGMGAPLTIDTDNPPILWTHPRLDRILPRGSWTFHWKTRPLHWTPRGFGVSKPSFRPKINRIGASGWKARNQGLKSLPFTARVGRYLCFLGPFRGLFRISEIPWGIRKSASCAGCPEVEDVRFHRRLGSTCWRFCVGLVGFLGFLVFGKLNWQVVVFWFGSVHIIRFGGCNPRTQLFCFQTNSSRCPLLQIPHVLKVFFEKPGSPW